MLEFPPSKAGREPKKQWLFADNTTGKETAMPIMITDTTCMMINISDYFTYLDMVWSRCSRISEGPLYLVKAVADFE